jgi:beta-N-acetylhexosaminidase
MRDWERIAGGTLLVGIEGAALDAAAREALAEIRPAGAVLFARNLVDVGQSGALVMELARAIARAPLVAIDQEGGRVSRLERWIGPTPPASRFALAGHEAARRFGAATGSALRALGFNLDFAPVVDLCEPHVANGIGDRSFANDPVRVVTHAGAFLEGLQGAGVAGTLKHFPGLGATSVDSHETLPTAHADREELERRHLVPFERLAPFAAAVMVGHAHYPALDEAPGRPASLSMPIVSGLLRGSVGFRGLVVSDDLEMGAVAPLDVQGAAAVRALEAGCDLLLYCRRLELAAAAARALADRARSDACFGARLSAADDAVRAFAARWPVAAPDAERFERARLATLDAARAVGTKSA